MSDQHFESRRLARLLNQLDELIACGSAEIGRSERGCAEVDQLRSETALQCTIIKNASRLARFVIWYGRPMRSNGEPLVTSTLEPRLPITP